MPHSFLRSQPLPFGVPCFRLATLAMAVATLLLTGCATLVKPESLAIPSSITCINVREKTSFFEERGPLKLKWETALTPGLYLSEREDKDGVYYRAPAGGLGVFSQDAPGASRTYDGGIYVPRDPAKAPLLYNYFSVDSVPPAAPVENADCTTATYVKDPVTRKISVLAIAAGGAAGGLATRTAVPGSRVSYGQAAAGGAIGGGIVAAMINADIGNINLRAPLENAAFVARLKNLAAQAIIIPEAPAAAPAAK